ncbi:hypothetical protein GLU60_02235 [Nanohaloarchaea archaeon H01]|nr:hypothetical protein [Nanohaloarchaea archaeon H01]
MKVRDLGGDDPDHAVMYCVHGNEPCGKLAVDRILHEEPELKKPIKLVLANEKAYTEGKTHLDGDLNRAWNSRGSSTHESSLSEKIKEEIQGKTVLDIHPSFSYPEAFGLITENPEGSRKQLDRLGLDHIADMRGVYNSKIPDVHRVAVECGYTRSQKAIDNAYAAIKNFMKANSIIEGEVARNIPEEYKLYERVTESDYQFIHRNFEKVEKGQTYAISEKERLDAKEDFYPVLMSTTGYQDMIGFKAKKKDRGELRTNQKSSTLKT